jgi:hypothetical protein
MLNEQKRDRLEKIAVTVAHLRGKKTQVEGEVQRLAATVTKAILEGRDPQAEHKAKKDELLAIDAEIAKLQSEGQEIISVALAEVQSELRKHNDAIFAARRLAGEKLRDFLTLWFGLDQAAAPMSEALKEFSKHVSDAEKRIGGIRIFSSKRVDAASAIPPRPSWHGDALRRGNGDELLRIMLKDLSGVPFQP